MLKTCEAAKTGTGTEESPRNGSGNGKKNSRRGTEPQRAKRIHCVTVESKTTLGDLEVAVALTLGFGGASDVGHRAGSAPAPWWPSVNLKLCASVLLWQKREEKFRGVTTGTGTFLERGKSLFCEEENGVCPRADPLSCCEGRARQGATPLNGNGPKSKQERRKSRKIGDHSGLRIREDLSCRSCLPAFFQQRCR